MPQWETSRQRRQSNLEAFSEPDDGRYSRITFCNDFFKLPTFKDAIAAGRKLPAAQKTDLEKWNNRARCFFHEITHLDYFMNAGDSDGAKSPYVSDLEVEYIVGMKEWHDAYGPYNAKILRNWVDEDPQWSGYFTQRNADNYAFFALAKFVPISHGGAVPFHISGASTRSGLLPS
jgi:hypothetical protein